MKNILQLTNKQQAIKLRDLGFNCPTPHFFIEEQENEQAWCATNAPNPLAGTRAPIDAGNALLDYYLNILTVSVE